MTTSALATELLTDMVTTDSGIDMMIGIGLNKESDAVFSVSNAKSANYPQI